MARWVAAIQPVHVLEPAIGTGILARAVQNYAPNCQFTGFDLDPIILTSLKQEGQLGELLKVYQEDFLRSNPTARYDGIIANPPYLKFHDYDNLPIIQHIQSETGIKLSGFTNIYALFVIKALRQLEVGGRAAFVVPSEFLNADYGVNIKQALITEGSLRHVLVVDFQGSVFADALTTACVLLFSRDKAHQPEVTFSNLHSVEALANWEPEHPGYPPLAVRSLDPSVKWRRYYQQHQLERPAYEPLVPFSMIGKVSRGIATGDNEYFTFSASKANKLGLDPTTSLSLCVARSADIPGNFFTAETLASLIQSDKTIYLLNAQVGAGEGTQLYLDEGVRKGINKKHLPAHRKIWHRPENRLPSPIWVTVFNRGGLRFIRNETNTMNLTTFHSVYLNPIYQSLIEVVMAYLLTDIAREIFADNRREYGNGLEKFEPNDLNNALMLDISHLSKQQITDIEKLYKQFRQSAIEEKPDETIRLKIDGYFRASFAS